MARTINYRVKAGPGALQRAVIDESALPQSITGLVNGTTYEVDTGFGTWVDVTPVAPANLILDQMIALGYAAECAFSTRKLRAAYAGSAIRVRRSSDNTEQDIGFDGSNNLDTTALASFIGANSGFIVTWYDQTTNGRNITNTTQANQPRIRNAGANDVIDSRVAAFFDGSNDSLRSATGLTVTVNSVNAVVRKSTSTGVRTMIRFEAQGGGAELAFRQGSGTAYGAYKLPTTFQGGTFPADVRHAVTAVGQDSGLMRLYGNGTLVGSAASAWGTGNTITGTQGFTVGANWSNAELWSGHIGEVMAFTTSLATADRATLEADQLAYWV